MPDYLPAGNRSPTAVSGVTDKRDENLYSAALLQNTGQGEVSLFTVPKSGAIPFLRGTSTASANQWQINHGDHTTNMEKAGELGDGIGDAAVRGLALQLEEASYLPSSTAVANSGNVTTYGGTQVEVAELNRKTSFEFKVSKKPMFKSPFFAFPSVGGAVASLATTVNAQLVSTATNGRPGAIRRLMTHIMIGRRDTLEAVFKVAGGSSLLFRTPGAGSDGIPSLLWCIAPATIRGDAR